VKLSYKTSQSSQPQFITTIILPVEGKMIESICPMNIINPVTFSSMVKRNGLSTFITNIFFWGIRHASAIPKAETAAASAPL
jgi:hypothetical protein